VANNPSELFDLLEKNLDDIIPRLTMYTLNKMKKRYWRGVRDGNPPGGQEAIDFVLQAIEKIISGQRNWNPQTQPDLFGYLKDIIDSDINHLVESWENKNFQSESSLMGDCTDNKDSYFDKLPSSISTPSEIMLQEEDERLNDKFLWGFYDCLADEPQLIKVVECIIDGIHKPSDIATKMGISTKEVYNIKKQLQRRLNDYRSKQSLRSLPATKGGKTNG